MTAKTLVRSVHAQNTDMHRAFPFGGAEGVQHDVTIPCYGAKSLVIPQKSHSIASISAVATVQVATEATVQAAAPKWYKVCSTLEICCSLDAGNLDVSCLLRNVTYRNVTYRIRGF